ncbi:MAG: CopG family ribbon-helix-helix protein [Halobaculum sp.]
MADTELLTARLPAQFMDRVDEAWKDRGFTSRSEFVRTALRDAVEAEPALTQEAIDAAEADETMSLDEAKRRLADRSAEPSPSDD